MAYALFASALMITACTDGTIIGNDLIGNEVIELDFNDNLEFSGQTTLGDSVATYRLTTTHQTYMLGQIDEPIFGKYSSDIYFGMNFNATFPDFSNSVIDSVILDLEYDSIGFYGESNVIHNFEVFEVVEDIFSNDTIYSNQSFETEMMPLASVSMNPDRFLPIDIKFREEGVDSTITLSPRLRIRLDDAFGTKLLEDSAAQVSVEDFRENFKGLYIKSTTEGSSMIGLNFNENPDFNDGIARLHVYYTQTQSNGEETLEEYSYLMRAATSSTFVHDYEGSEVGNAIGDTMIGDEFLFCHAMAGVNAELNFPDINFLDNNNEDTIIINSAQLVLTVNEDESQFLTDDYPSLSQFLLSKENEDGDGRVLIDDATKDGIDITVGLQILDGVVRETTLESGEIVKTVTFNVTDFVQNLLKNDITSEKLTISPVGRSESPRRTVFYGAKHPEFPAKLRIAYTRI